MFDDKPGNRTFIVGALCTLAVIARMCFLPSGEFVSAMPHAWTIIAGFGAAYGVSKAASGLRTKWTGEGVRASRTPPEGDSP